MNAMKNRKLLVLLVRFSRRDVRGDGQDGVVADEREYRDAYRAPAATVDQTPRAAGQADEALPRPKRLRTSPTRKWRTGRSPRRKPRGHLDAAQLHLLFAASSWPSRSSRSSSRRSATRPGIRDTTGSRTSFTKAPLGLVLHQRRPSERP